MSTLLVVFAQKLLFGMAHIVLILSLVEEVKSTIWIIIVSVLKTIIGVAPLVLSLLALAVKFGKGLDAFVLQEKIIMAQCAYSASMDKLGTQSIKDVRVKMDINGTASIVKGLTHVQEIECGTQHINSVFVKIHLSGVGMPACLFLSVVEGNIGMQYWWNVFAVLIFNGMGRHALFVEMDKFGIHLLFGVFVHPEQSQLEESVRFSNSAQVVRSLSRIQWNASALKLLSGMEIIVFQIRAQMEDNIAHNISHVCAQIIKFGIITGAFLLKHLVQEEWSGIMPYMLANAPMVLSQIIINVTLFQSAEMVWPIILSQISAHALLEKF